MTLSLSCPFVRPYPFFSLVSKKFVLHLECRKATISVKVFYLELMGGARCFKDVSRVFQERLKIFKVLESYG